jgi:hypothetical protein
MAQEAVALFLRLILAPKRGIHHQCSEKHYQKYLDEYCFRTNRRNTEQGIFKAIMLRAAKRKTYTFKELIAYAA